MCREVCPQWVESGHSAARRSSCPGRSFPVRQSRTTVIPLRRKAMTIPQWALLAFAVWTVLVLFGTIGVYRWSRILTGRVSISEWQADLPQGSDWYRRAMRAHMNCVENLAVFGAIVFCATGGRNRGPLARHFCSSGDRRARRPDFYPPGVCAVERGSLDTVRVFLHSSDGDACNVCIRGDFSGRSMNMTCASAG